MSLNLIKSRLVSTEDNVIEASIVESYYSAWKVILIRSAEVNPGLFNSTSSISTNV